MAGSGPHHLVALPYPGRGHINPMMNLSEHLLARAHCPLLITFVVTEEWLGLLGPAPVSPRLQGIRFRTIPNVIPSELNRGADYVGFYEAVYTRMEAPFEELLRRIQEEGGAPPVEGIISDTELPWAVAVGNRRDIPVYSLSTMSATFLSVVHHFHLIPSGGRLPPLSSSEKWEESLDFIPGITSLKMADIQSVCSLEKPLKLLLDALSWVNKAQCLLFTSFNELEQQALDALKASLPIPVYPVGPSIPYMALHDKPNVPLNNGHDAIGYHSWLDSQPRSSVLFVSLGSFLSVSSEQMDEIAWGLRASGAHFLWVARRDPLRMQELGGCMGLVVPWCDQLRVLCHPSIGGFLTHCGWNSTLEAVFAGVPTLTFPIFWDQPPNSRLMVDDWKMGLSLKGETVEGGHVSRGEIMKRVKRLMDSEGDERNKLQTRAGELREACNLAIQVGGSSTISLDAFIAHVVRENKQ
uniref:Glycosyltransferase n=1 Tax=Anthurium amnicola TaxID=1678845 RepID=A0A1D1XV72_9ARAE